MQHTTCPVAIDDLAFGGDGVGRLPDGRAVFVPFTIPGERAVVEIVEEHKRFARGVLQEMVERSPFRITPACPLFGRCGGCQYQHIAYEQQVDFKCKQLLDTLQRVGRIADPAPVSIRLPSPRPLGYRNKLTLEPFMQDGRTDYGFFSHAEQTFLAVEACPLADSEINELLPEARAKARVDESPNRRLLLRKPAKGGAVWFLGRPGQHADWLPEAVDGKTTRVPPGVFWQVNPAVGARLAETVIGWVDGLPADILVDAYAGAGFFSLAAGQRFKAGVLIESDPRACRASRWNHRHQNLCSREILHGKTERHLPRVLEQAGDRRAHMLVIADPPRSGCGPAVIQSLVDFPVAFLIYISCNPATLARDLKALCDREAGPYQIKDLLLADMFPQTAHFESAVLLKRK